MATLKPMLRIRNRKSFYPVYIRISNNSTTPFAAAASRCAVFQTVHSKSLSGLVIYTEKRKITINKQ
jgi:hypothetical protein